MSELFDDVTRAVAAPVSRRQALRLIAGTVGAVLLTRFARAPRPAVATECDPANDPMYPHPCRDICCRYDYYCASTGLLNGADTYGICCTTGDTALCSAGGYGWCCPPDRACGATRFTCERIPCQPDAECGEACCDTAAGEFCCDPDENLCCTAEMTCAPISTTGLRTCCPPDQACKGQCCLDWEVCIFGLDCCPADRANTERDGCCSPGFLYHALTDSCCPEGKFCRGECCQGSQVCIDDRCQQCPEGRPVCFDTCCAPGTCCFGNCCGAGQTCTGECTTLETITGTVDPETGGELASSDGGVTISFIPLGTEETVQYTSQAQPGHPLREGDQLLRSFTLISPAAGSRPEQGQMVFYTMRVRYTEATLAAMGVESEFQLQLLWWDASSSAWAPAFYPEIDRAAGEVIVTQALLGEFALVAGEEVQGESQTVYLPLVTQ